MDEVKEMLARIEHKLDRLGSHASTPAHTPLDLSVRPSKGADSEFARRIAERAPKGQGWLHDNLVIGWIAGSHLYGTNTPTSDVDYVGVVIPPVSCKLGLQRFDEADLSTKSSGAGHRNTADDVDLKLYSLDKFLGLAMDNNPNIIEFLFAPERSIVYASALGRELMSIAEKFPCGRAAHAFSGYAYSQIKRLQVKKGNMTGRTELAEKYGYDTKFLSHAFRLLYEGIELMKSGRIEMPLRERTRLVQIRNGFYPTIEDGLAAAEELLRDFETAKATSILPAKPDHAFFNAWLIEKYRAAYNV